MKITLRIMKVDKLIPHEEFNLVHAVSIADKIRNEGIRKPIVVELRTGVILDGHHRTAGYKILHREYGNYTRIPAYVVDAFAQEIGLETRNSSILSIDKYTKGEVLFNALNGYKLPVKTTMWTYKGQPIGKIHDIKDIDSDIKMVKTGLKMRI